MEFLKNVKVYHWVGLFFLLVLTLRLILAFTIPNFTYESYFHLRQVEHITNDGFPLYKDNLSSGGRDYFFLPLFHYFVSLFDLFLPLEIVAKIIPNLLYSILIIIVFLFAKVINSNESGALLSSVIVGILPILFNTNYFGPQPLFLVLIFLSIYFFMKLRNDAGEINNKKYLLYSYIFFFLLACLTSAASFLILIGFLIYILFNKIDNKKIELYEVEVILFSLFLYLWIQFLFYKNLFLDKGINFIWQNIPPSVLLDYFPTLSIAKALVSISLIPFLIGLLVIRKAIFDVKREKYFLLISLAISTALLLLFRLIDFSVALSFFGIILAILFADFYTDIEEFLNRINKRVKIDIIKKYFFISVLIILIISTLIPALQSVFAQNLPTPEEIDAFKWLRNNSPQNYGVVSLLEEGSLVVYYGQRKNFMDDKFVGVKDVEKRLNNLNSLYNTKFQTHAISILNDYDYQYLVLTPKAKFKYNISSLDYLSPECFERVYRNETRIYWVKCVLTKT